MMTLHGSVTMEKSFITIQIKGGNMTKRNISQKEIDHVEQYMAVELTYSKSLIMPYTDGIKFLAALEQAELIESSIHEIANGNLKFHMKNSVTFDIATVPQRDYREAKMDLLLGLEPEPKDDDD